MRIRRRAVITAVLVSLVVTSGIAAANATGKPVLSVFAPDNEFAPGEDGELELYVQNAGEVAYASNPNERDRVTTARDVVVKLSAGDAPIEIETANGKQPMGNVPEGVSAPVSFSIKVDEGAEPGEYPLPVRFEYTYTRVISRIGVHDENDGRLNTHITLLIENDASFRILDASAADLYGDRGPVSLTLENDGSATARDATVTLESGAPELSFDGDQTAKSFIGEWAPGETHEIRIMGSVTTGADRRSYPISATVRYEDDDGEARTSDPVSTGVTPPIESRFALQTVESSLAVGEEGTVSGTVINNGASVARNAVLVLSADTRNFEPIETEYALGDLRPGDPTEFSFDAEVSESAASGPRQLSLSVRYRDRTDRTLESDPLDLRVEVGPERNTFSVEPVSANLQHGESGQIRLRVTNQGDETVTDISAKLFANTPLSTTDDEAFIAHLEPGASEEIVFGISASGAALTKTYPVSLDFQYGKDGDTLLSDTYQVPVSVASRSDDDGGLPIGLLIGGGILIVIGAGAYIVFRRG